MIRRTPLRCKRFAYRSAKRSAARHEARYTPRPRSSTYRLKCTRKPGHSRRESLRESLRENTDGHMHVSRDECGIHLSILLLYLRTESVQKHVTRPCAKRSSSRILLPFIVPMPVPKKRLSKAKTRTRKTSWKQEAQDKAQKALAFALSNLKKRLSAAE